MKLLTKVVASAVYVLAVGAASIGAAAAGIHIATRSSWRASPRARRLPSPAPHRLPSLAARPAGKLPIKGKQRGPRPMGTSATPTRRATSSMSSAAASNTG
jgi:hypothetical protein